MFGGVNPKQMQGMMKKMGISQEEISAEKVIIEKRDGTVTIIENPSVIRIKMQGQTSFQISGEVSEKSKEVEISSEDIYPIDFAFKCFIRNSVVIVPTKPKPGKPSMTTGDFGLSFKINFIKMRFTFEI